MMMEEVLRSLAICAVLLSCNAPTAKKTAEAPPVTLPPAPPPIDRMERIDTDIRRNTLEGTWQLRAAKLAHTGEGESDEFTNDSEVVALKIFTRNRFAVVRYHKETGTLLGTGGGTYIQLGDEFTEYIDYHSWDSTLVDFPQTFTCIFEGDLFTQEGVIRGGATDGSALEEIYQRIEPPISQVEGTSLLAGSWKLEKWANGERQMAVPLPRNHYGFKIFTPGYFYALRYRETGGVDNFSFGTYKATPDYLTETIISLGDLSAVGRTFTYTWSVKESVFNMVGFIDSDQFMGHKIDEYYARE
ncbi:MAG: hypothetical protein HKN87_01255 [Saprospiraceae bacterium]|nr:hypothetical protein [Saprospiraceae bacterium]